MQHFAPNLIMPGSAKCGTTTLHAILASHPAIVGGVEKEVRFLVDPHDELAPDETIHNVGLEGWRAQFPDRGESDARYWLDASPPYQYSATAKKVIGQLDIAPRLVFIVRRPSDRLYSLYQYAKYQHRALGDISTFPDFIAAIRPPVDPVLTSQNMMRSAWRDTRYDEMLEDWRAVVDPRLIWTTSVEALKADRTGQMMSLANWLKIDPGPLLDMSDRQANRTMRTRSMRLRHLYKQLAPMLPETAPVRALKNLGKRLNSAPLDQSEKDANRSLLREIDAEFAASTARFNALARETQPDHYALPV